MDLYCTPGRLQIRRKTTVRGCILGELQLPGLLVSYDHIGMDFNCNVIASIHCAQTYAEMCRAYAVKSFTHKSASLVWHSLYLAACKSILLRWQVVITF